MLTLIMRMVRATTTHSDSELNASMAATASLSLDGVTGAGRLSKPPAPGDRIMAGILQGENESLPRTNVILQRCPAILRRTIAGKRRNSGGKRGFIGL
jgi:hypothetical protein